jgi:FkbM family methyltransferase
VNVSTINVEGRCLHITGAHEPYLAEVAATDWDKTPLVELVRGVPSGSTYLDVGANIGVTAVVAASLRPDIQIIAFEPVPSNADLLERNLARNGATNCRVMRTAIGDVAGTVRITDHGPWSTIGDDAPVAVPVTPLDTYCRDERVSLIKIDVEGYEPRAITGAAETIARCRPTILLEFNAVTLIRADVNIREFAAFLWRAFEVESEHSDPWGFVYANLLNHRCLDDIVLRPRAGADFHFANAEDRFLRSTSWRVTAPLRWIKRRIG